MAVTYSESKMKGFVDRDGYLSFLYKDLMKRNDNDEAFVLKVIFNSEVRGYSVMEKEYNK